MDSKLLLDKTIVLKCKKYRFI